MSRLMGGRVDYRDLEAKAMAQAAWFREGQLRARRAWARRLVVDLALGHWNSTGAGAWGGPLRKFQIPVEHDGTRKIWEIGSDTFERLFERGDIHRDTAAQMFRKMEEAVTAEERSVAKTVSFDSLYGRPDTGRLGPQQDWPPIRNR